MTWPRGTGFKVTQMTHALSPFLPQPSLHRGWGGGLNSGPGFISMQAMCGASQGGRHLRSRFQLPTSTVPGPGRGSQWVPEGLIPMLTMTRTFDPHALARGDRSGRSLRRRLYFPSSKNSSPLTTRCSQTPLQETPQPWEVTATLPEKG